VIELLIVPFILCVALVLIHVYFGSFVLKRGVIFIDLALAQWAALGYLIGHWAGVPAGLTLFVFAWGFTVIAAFILSFLKPIYQDLNLQEAVIGVLYIGAAAIATGLISLTGMEGHHLSHMLAGHLLFVQPVELYASLGVYALIGVMLLWLHRYFLNENSRGSEFVFCVLFGLVVTSSVQLVGILLVFSYLVIPPPDGYVACIKL
jgi:ABC-type Mn2+/Zn2+ transport systems, permease components